MLDLIYGRPKPKAFYADWQPMGSGFSRYWWGGQMRTQAGVVVDHGLALTLAAVWCATRILSEIPSMLPFNLYERLPDGGKRIALDHEIHHIVSCQPNQSMTAMPFWESRAAHTVNWGNGFAEIVRDRRGNLAELHPIHPSRVKPRKKADTEVSAEFPYLVRNNDGSETPMRADEILHIPGCISEEGMWGKGCIPYAREDTGTGLAMGRHSATYFSSGATARGVLKVPGMKDRDARASFRAEWKDVHGSPDSGEVILLPPEADFTQISISNEASQFLESRKFNVEEIFCRWYRLPAHFAGLLDKASYASIEMQSLEFVVYGLMPWLIRKEQHCNWKLLTPEERKTYFFEHELTGLLRGDFETRMRGYQIALGIGILSINEVRRLENREVLPAELGDVHFVPGNWTTVERMVSGQLGAGDDAAGLLPAPAGSSVPSVPSVSSLAWGDLKDNDQALPYPDVPQKDNYSCGAAISMSVGGLFKVGPKTLEEWKTALGTTVEHSTEPMRIVEYFTELGLAVTACHDLTIDDLRAAWRQGKASICPIQEYGVPSKQASFNYGHYVGVAAVWPGFVQVQDPSIDNVLKGQDADQAPGQMVIDYQRWNAGWHDEDWRKKQFVHFAIMIGRRAVDAEDDDDEDDGTGGNKGNGEKEKGDSNGNGTKNTSGGNNDGKSAPNSNTAATAAAAQRQGVQAVLADVLGRMFGKESKQAARAAAAKGQGLEAWLAGFYPAHRANLLTALEAPALLMRSQGQPINTQAIADAITTESMGLLRDMYNRDTRAQFAAKLETWPTERAQAWAEKILKGEL